LTGLAVLSLIPLLLLPDVKDDVAIAWIVRPDGLTFKRVPRACFINRFGLTPDTYG